MIQNFRSKDTEKLFAGEYVKKFTPSLARVALRKLTMLHAAVELEDLRVPPGNHLERLKGGRQDQYSIRINDQWRICFRWKNGNVEDTEIVDYHS